MSGTYTFSKYEFPSLNFQEFLGAWNPVGFEDLSPSEQEFMSVMISYLFHGQPEGVENRFDYSDILLVKAGEGGLLKDVYGPSIFRDGDSLVLKMGANQFPVLNEKAEFKVGGLEGTLEFASEPQNIKLKDAKGEEYEVAVYPCTLSLMPFDGAEFEFKVRVSLDAASNPEPAKIKQALKRGDSIAQYVRSVPVPGQGGGNEAVRMQDLGTGEFAVKAVRQIETDKYGTRFILSLADGTDVWSRGMIDSILKDSECHNNIVTALDNNKPVTLAVTSIRKVGDKYYVDCALRFREPLSAEELAARKAPGKVNSKGSNRPAVNDRVADAVKDAAAKGKAAAVAGVGDIPF